MTAVQVAGAAISAFMVWWKVTLIRSARRQQRWHHTEARIIGTSRWRQRYRLRFAATDGGEVSASCGTDADGPRLAPGEMLAIVYDPNDPTRCEPAMTQAMIAGLRLIGVAAMAGGVAMLVWG